MMTGDNWGGARPGAGRKPEYEEPPQQLYVRATDAEFESIKANLNPRERGEILAAIATGTMTTEDAQELAAFASRNREQSDDESK